MIRRLLADANLNAAIATGLVRNNSEINFQRAEDVPLKGLPDQAVLAAAAQQSRVLVSHDIRSIPAHLRDFIRENDSPGVIPHTAAYADRQRDRKPATGLRGVRRRGFGEHDLFAPESCDDWILSLRGDDLGLFERHKRKAYDREQWRRAMEGGPES
jgi:hypothetical protein